MIDEKKQHEMGMKTVDIHQALIARMAAASSTAKTWCVTVVSAVAVVAIEKGKWQIALVGIIATLLFAAIDIYYLTIEKDVRNFHEEFCKLFREGVDISDKLFQVRDTSINSQKYIKSAASKSISFFYPGILIGLIAIAIIIALKN
jgi:hypothetical protein